VATISEAVAGKISKNSRTEVEFVPMPFSFVGVELHGMLAFSSSTSVVTVEDKGDWEEVLARGGR
jgi:hypothetical protein